MEVIKESSNVEFDVIYADGARKRVREGILYEAEESGDILFHNGTDQPAVLLATAETALVSLKQIDSGLEALATGMALTEDTSGVLKSLVEFASELLGIDSEIKDAAYRLGQRHARANIADMLTEAASDTFGTTRAALRIAVDMINAMEVP